MRWIYKLPLRFRSLLRKSRVERELSDELRFHLEKLIEEKVAQGMAPEEARHAALREIGGIEQITEKCRDMRRVNYIEHFLQDVRYGLRMLRKSPTFTAVAVLTLALGIGANTAIFSLIDAVMLRSLPVKNPQQLVQLKWISGGVWPKDTTTSGYGGASFSYPWLEQLRAHNTSFSSVFAFASLGFDKPNVNINVGGEPRLGSGMMISGDFFSGLGVTPILGRAIVDEDEKPGAPLAAVISYSFWTNRFVRNPSAVGATIKLNDVPFTIAGVAPPEFFGLDAGRVPDVWIPVIDRTELRPWASPPAGGEPMRTSNHWWWINVMGRLKAGVSEAQARTATDALFRASTAASLNLEPGSAEVPRADLISASHGLNRLRRRFSQPLLVLMVVVALVLLIACANVAGLLLARASARRKEISVRMALGASRARLVRQLLTESLLLSGIGGAAGLLFASWFSGALVRLISSGGTAIVLDVRPDPVILAFTAAAAVATGVLSGLAPAFRGTHVDVTPALKESGALLAGGRSARASLGKSLVVAQVALSLLLLVGAGLFLRTLENLRGQDFGFDRSHLLMFGVDPMQAGYSGARIKSIYVKLLDALRGIAGVRSASISQLGLITGWQSSGPIYVDGFVSSSEEDTFAEWNSVGSDFFETVGIRRLLGRGIEQRDIDGASRVAVVNEVLARHYFGDANPIGRHFNQGTTRDLKHDYEIIGVVQSAKYADVREAPPRTFYVPYTLDPPRPGGMYFEVNTASDPSAMVAAVRATVRQIDPGLPLFDLKTQDAQIDESLMQERLFAELSGFFGALAVLLAGIGLYGLLSYAVTQRFREIGIRVALGALPRDVLRLVIWQGIGLTLIGLAIGIAAALGVTRLMDSLLYGVQATDPLTFVGVSLILLGVALFACSVPARRAMQVDPMVALRYE